MLDGFVLSSAVLPARSMEICAFLIAQHSLVVPCESGREDLKKFTAELTALKPGLVSASGLLGRGHAVRASRIAA